MNGQSPSKINNAEWGLVIGALLLIDVVQIGIDLLGVGLFVNWLVDAFVGMAFAFYLQMRGESLADGKRLLGLVVAFFGGELSGGALPLWVLDGVWCWFISRSKNTVLKKPETSQISEPNNVYRFPDRQNKVAKNEINYDDQIAA